MSLPAARSEQPPLRTVIVDDSAVFRRIMERAVAEVGGLELVGTARDGREGVELAEREEPDLVLLDIEMPRMNGLEALDLLVRRHPGLVVIMVSSLSAADHTVRCLEAGALDFVPKPTATSPESARRRLVLDLRLRLAAVHARRARNRLGPRFAHQETTPQAPALRPPRSFSVLAIGSSTGGPGALMKLLPELRPRFPLPVVIVQHMPPGFTASLARQLDVASALPVGEARDGEILAGGRVYLAPGGRHLEVSSVRDGLAARLVDGPPVHGVRPSVDTCLASLARAAPGPVLAVVLTGMGRDGTRGVAALGRKAWCIAQDRATSVVYGMPRAVAEEGLAHEVLPLEAIGPRINFLCGVQR